MNYERGEDNNLNYLNTNLGRNYEAGVNWESGKKFFENRIACEWLNTKEAAHFLSVSENALRIMVYRDQVPAYRFGRRLRFKLQDCQALFKTKGA